MSREHEAATLEKQWRDDPRWRGVERGYSAADVVRLRGSVPIEHTLARRGAERLWKTLETQPFVRTLGSVTGNQAVQMAKAGLQAIYLSGWQVAADANSAGQMYPDQSLYPRRQRARSAPCDQRRAGPGRPDPSRGGRRFDRLVPARGRRRGIRLRRGAERLRADEGHDRRGRGRRALRGSALLGEEVRPHGRQGAGADPGGGAEAGRGAPRGRRLRGAHPAHGPHRTRSARSCSPATSIPTTSPSSPASGRRRGSTR